MNIARFLIAHVHVLKWIESRRDRQQRLETAETLTYVVFWPRSY